MSFLLPDMINSYFKTNFIEGSDQELLQALVNQSIQTNGRDIYYIPRNFIAFDRLFGEDKLSAFNTYYTVEMYIQNFMGFGDRHEFISHFGMEIRDQITMQVSKTRFKDEITNKNNAIVRPMEGDLLFFPLDKSLFEITFVENEELFYQLGKLYTYQLTCKRFEYASEKFDTGIDEVDTIPTTFGNSTELMLGTDV